MRPTRVNGGPLLEWSRLRRGHFGKVPKSNRERTEQEGCPAIPGVRESTARYSLEQFPFVRIPFLAVEI
jgi:hypothetical protein